MAELPDLFRPMLLLFYWSKRYLNCDVVEERGSNFLGNGWMVGCPLSSLHCSPSAQLDLSL